MDEEKAECWVVQNRIKSKSSTTWGDWVVRHEYQDPERAKARCQSVREAIKKFGLDKKADEEWRVLHVTQEVVY